MGKDRKASESVRVIQDPKRIHPDDLARALLPSSEVDRFTLSREDGMKASTSLLALMLSSGLAVGASAQRTTADTMHNDARHVEAQRAKTANMDAHKPTHPAATQADAAHPATQTDATHPAGHPATRPVPTTQAHVPAAARADSHHAAAATPHTAAHDVKAAAHHDSVMAA